MHKGDRGTRDAGLVLQDTSGGLLELLLIDRPIDRWRTRSQHRSVTVTRRPATTARAVPLLVSAYRLASSIAIGRARSSVEPSRSAREIVVRSFVRERQYHRRHDHTQAASPSLTLATALTDLVASVVVRTHGRHRNEGGRRLDLLQARAVHALPPVGYVRQQHAEEQHHERDGHDLRRPVHTRLRLLGIHDLSDSRHRRLRSMIESSEWCGLWAAGFLDASERAQRSDGEGRTMAKS